MELPSFLCCYTAGPCVTDVAQCLNKPSSQLQCYHHLKVAILSSQKTRDITNKMTPRLTSPDNVFKLTHFQHMHIKLNMLRSVWPMVSSDIFVTHHSRYKFHTQKVKANAFSNESSMDRPLCHSRGPLTISNAWIVLIGSWFEHKCINDLNWIMFFWKASSNIVAWWRQDDMFSKVTHLKLLPHVQGPVRLINNNLYMKGRQGICNH